ncbi:MAG: protein-export chaperone SecB [Alphaproteobacteria bacterium]
MTDEAEAAEGVQVQLALIAQYLKDLSFENPNAPAILQELQSAKPNVNVNVNVNAQKIGQDGYEVVLSLATEAKIGDKVAFIVEVDYAALWGIRGVTEEQLQPVLLVECPRLMFPFARSILADAIREGGFPQVLLDPIDFAGLFRQQQTASQQTMN